MLWCMDSLSCDFDFVDHLLIWCSKDDSSKISSGVKHLWSNDIVKPKCIPDEIIRSKFLLRDLYKTAFHCGTDRHVAPCILCNNQVLPNRIGDAFKLLLIFRQREEKTCRREIPPPPVRPETTSSYYCKELLLSDFRSAESHKNSWNETICVLP